MKKREPNPAMGPSVDEVSPLVEAMAELSVDSGEGLLSTGALTLLELYTAQVEEEVTGQSSSRAAIAAIQSTIGRCDKYRDI